MLGEAVRSIRERALPEGGFRSGVRGGCRGDATAWAVLALRQAGVEPELWQAGAARLAAAQLPDGRVPVTPQHPEAFFPTPVAVLAWQGLPDFEAASRRAVGFLLATTGKHFPKKSDDPADHDTAIPGWPWIADTHSWVEPTALALLALRIHRHGDHFRSREAQRLLLDRQLPGGGWNYGNTRVFGVTLQPLPDSTGVALTALAQLVPRAQVAASLDYLQRHVSALRTPKSLGWSLLGLTAWGERPPESLPWLADCLRRQEVVPFDMESLAVLTLAFCPEGGLLPPRAAAPRREGDPS